MQEAAVSLENKRATRWRSGRLTSLAKDFAPSRREFLAACASAALLVASFPDFNLWFLAWVALVPLLFAVASRPQPVRAFLLGWLAGTVFFYGSCYWLTFAMINYGGIPAVVAYTLLLPGAAVVGLFPATACLVLARLCQKRGAHALFAAPFIWAACEWLRFLITGQLWNAVGYSQAYVPQLIQIAKLGGVYAIGFVIVSVNAALAYLILKRTKRAALVSSGVIAALALLTTFLALEPPASETYSPSALVVAVQPNVAVNFARSAEEEAQLVERHIVLSEEALAVWERTQWGKIDRLRTEADARGGWTNADQKSLVDYERLRDLPRVVVFPESPMNFRYSANEEFRERVASFTRRNHTSLLFNSLQPAPGGGAYNSAVLVDETGRLTAQYDKIRLLPFGEYVPVPRWLPGATLLPTMVGDFTPGDKYPLLPAGDAKIGVFICFESAFPELTGRFAREGADALINISNDGYLGKTPVLRQHLANTIMRAVETGRPVMRVTNTGISALVDERGRIVEQTNSYEPTVRAWTLTRPQRSNTFYTILGDTFAACCAVVSFVLLALTFKRRKRATNKAV